MKKMLLVPIILPLSLIGGCANHLPTQVVIEPIVDRVVVDHHYSLETDAKGYTDHAYIKLKSEESITYNVTKYEDTSTYDVFTPYQGVREFYEVPLGLITIPVAVAVNLVDFVLLGLIPNSLTNTPLNFGFAGLNPFLNIENDERTERTLISEQRNQIDAVEEFVKKPLNGELIKFSFGETELELPLDKSGKLSVNLLTALTSAEQPPREITFKVGDEKRSATQTLIISRKLRAQLSDAKPIMKKYSGDEIITPVNEDGSKDIDTMVQDVSALAEIGFEIESYSIEKEILSSLSTEEQEAFLVAQKALMSAP
jgi:hypothetical protein